MTKQDPSQRRLVQAAAWSIPAVAVTSAAPAVAATVVHTPLATVGIYSSFTSGINSPCPAGTKYILDGTIARGTVAHRGFQISDASMVKSYLLVLTVYLPENGLVFTESTGNKWAPDDRDGRVGDVLG
ncbi:MAG: hypothetical protein V9G04_09530 [Nocardioides sp.]|jgi:hypothetical protein